MSHLLFLGDKSIDQWRTAAQTTHRPQYKRLLQQADSYLNYLPPAEHPRDSITFIGMAVANLSLAYLLSEQAGYLDAARRWLKVGIGYPHWGRERLPDHDLDAAWLLFGFGLAYNWLGQALPAIERQALYQKLKHHGDLLYNFALETEGKWWGSAYWQNHNWICYGGLATVACALKPEYPPARNWFDRAVQNFQRVFALFPEDGSLYEGVIYWRYGFPWFLIVSHLFQEQGLDLHNLEFLRQTFFYRLYLSGPNLVDTANFGDCHDRRSAHSRAVYYRLAGLYQNGYAQWLAEHFEQTGEWEREGREGLVKPGLLPEAWLDFIWYDPTVKPEPIESLPPAHVFPDLGLITARSSWQPDAAYLAFKCSTPNGLRGWHVGHAYNRKNKWDIIKASHEHPDANSFILMRGDDYLVVDDGYNREKLTRNHSTILVDGQGQYNEGAYNAFRDLDASWGGRLESWFAAPGFTYVCGEAAGAYSQKLQLKQFRRQVMMLDDVVVVYDNLQSDQEHRYEWLLQLDTIPQPVAENRFIISAKNTTLHATALTPKTINYEVQAQEVAANPTSAKPDWIIRHTQHTLALRPASLCKDAHFLVTLCLQTSNTTISPQAQRLNCENGAAGQIVKAGSSITVAFAAASRKLVIPDKLLTDAGWCLVEYLEANGETRIRAGEITNLWLENELRFLASGPVSVAMHQADCFVSACHPTWISLRVPQKPNKVLVNQQETPAQFNPEFSLLRLQVMPGKSAITWQAGEGQ